MRGERSPRLAGSLSIRRGTRHEKGQATIEFALILPVILVMLLGIIKAGMLYNDYVALTDAVRVGARQLTLGRGLDDPCSPAVARTVTAAKPTVALARDQVSVTLLSPNTCGTPTGSGYTGGYMIQGDSATISATHPCDLVIFGIDFLPGCTLKASATQAIE